MKRMSRILPMLFTSRAFFAGTLVFFVLQALWFVFSAAYPMAFDEEVHMGIIRIYSQQWSPFLAAQAPGSDAFGAVIADPSYLYHYLMSYPYRLIAAVTSSEALQVIALRTINVAFFTYGLFVFKKVLREAGRSEAFSNLALAVFVLIPIVPMLAAHINYDNLLLVAVAWLVLLGLRLVAAMRQGRLRLDIWCGFLAVSLLGIAIKYVLLPMVLAGTVFLVIFAAWKFRGRLRTAAYQSWQALPRRAIFSLLVLLLVAAGFGAQRYATNQIRYGTVLPSCELVLGGQRCMSFGPWNRNHQLALTKGEFNSSPLYYTARWAVDLQYRLFFAVAGPGNTHATRPPLPIPLAVMWAIVAAALLAILAGLRGLKRHPQLLFLLVVAGAYLAALWLENYMQYLETGKVVAVNGRYLLPVLLPVAAVAGWSLRRVPVSPQIKMLIAAACLALLLYGGGALTYMYYAEPSWYWSADIVQLCGKVLRAIAQKIIIIDGYF